MVYLIAFILLCPFLPAQVTTGARNLAICSSDAAFSGDVFAGLINPAAFSKNKSASTGIDFSPAPFGLGELTHTALVLSIPFPAGTFSTSVKTYGYDLYRENIFSLHYSASLPDNIHAGISVNYHNLRIKNYGNDGTIYFNIGAIARLNRLFEMGFSISNINNASFGDEDNQIPVNFTSGLSLNLSNIFFIHLSGHKDVVYPFNTSAGFEYIFYDALVLRSGISTNPSFYTGGAGILFNQFTFDYGFSFHPELGITHQVSLVYNFSEIHTSVQAEPDNEN